MVEEIVMKLGKDATPSSAKEQHAPARSRPT
jgi:hypothetical protein